MFRRLRFPLVRPALLAALAMTFSDPARAQAAACTQPDYDMAPLTPEVSIDQNLVLEADDVLLNKGGLSKLAGAVKLRQGDKEFSAESMDYDDVTQTVTVKTESVFHNADLIIKSREASFDLNAESGAFSGTEFVLPTRAARGSSDKITLTSAGTAELQRSRYTTCAPDSNAWYLEASKIKLDHEKGLGTARNARLRFAGVPVLYIPWMQFPIDDQRRTGLLYPTAGESEKTGFDLRWPVYINLAPNYDATVTPRLMTDRGLQMGAAGRYLLREGEGKASYEFLDSDRVFGDSRSLVTFDHVGLINSRLGIEATYAEVSDPRYFEDLGGTADSVAITQLERAARLTYQAPAAYRVQMLVQDFQRIDSSLDDVVEDPYKRLPQIRFDALTRNDYLNTRAGLNGEFVNFARADSIEGQRVDIQPYLRFTRDEISWYFSSQGDLRYTGYQLTGTPEGQSDAPERTLPVLSAEGGLRFERVTHRGAIQTLEPRLFGLYVPYENQDDIPLFDTGEPDFDFVQLFARNRFSGGDRIADAQHIAAAVTTRVLDPESGLTRFSGSIGQLYRLEAPRVDIPGFEAPARGGTEFITELAYHFNASWSAVALTQWSPESSEFERSNYGVRYRDPDHDRRFDAAYRYRRGLLEQTDVSFSVPITGAWRLAARSRYSLQDNRSRESFGGIEYDTCCWTVRAAYRRYIADSDGSFNNGIYLQVELKGLTRIGAGYEGLLPLEEGDKGYNNTQPAGSRLGAAY